MSTDPEALFQEHLEFADRVAGALARRLPDQVDREDLRQAARLGLWQQAQKFNPADARGAAFTTFAYKRVRGAALDQIRRSVDVPPALRGAAGRLANEADAITAVLEATLGEESAEALARTVSDAVETLGVVFLASQLGDDAHDPEDTDASDPIEQDDLLRSAREVLDDLPDRQARVMAMLYGEGLTMTEAARRLHVNKSQVHRDHEKALGALRRALCPDRIEPPDASRCEPRGADAA